MANNVVRSLPLRLCNVVSPTGTSLKPFVRCPRRESSIDAQDCAGCMRMRTIEWDPATGGEVGCVPGTDVPAIDARADFAELAARTRMHEIGAPVVTFVTPEVRVAELPSDAPAFAVVDEEGKLVGMVLSSVRAHAPAESEVRDVMEREVHSLPEDAPISFALSLFSVEKLVAAPIVKVDRTVTGMCFADDLLRWVASQLGYAKR